MIQKKEGINNDFPEPRNLDQKYSENLKKVYGKDIFDVIKIIEDIEINTNNYFDTTAKEMSKKYSEFTEQIKRHINQKAFKFNEAFNLDKPQDKEGKEKKTSLVQKISSDIIQLLKKIIEMHKQIVECIQQNVNILSNFLNISKSLDKEKPIQDFLAEQFNNITKNWLFLNINLEKFNFSQAINDSDLNQNFKNFIYKVCQDKNFVMNIILPKTSGSEETIKKNLDQEIEKRRKKREEDIRMISENSSNLVKLKMENVDDVECYLAKNINFEKMKSLKFKNVTVKNQNLFSQLPNLEKLHIVSCPAIDISMLQNLSKNLKKLYLNRNNFVNHEFNFIMTNYLVNNPEIKKNLEVLSFADNNLTKIDLTQLPSKDDFEALKELDFHKNKIYKFLYNPENFSQLKLINCCKNNFNKSYFETINEIIGLESANGFLMDQKLSEDYYTNLQQKLSKEDSYPLKYLNITYIPSRSSKTYLEKLKINENIIINLKKLDLSYNGITCDTFFTFVGNNKGCLNLKSLKLVGNLIDDTFFEKYLKSNIFNKLQHLYLDSNRIGGEGDIEYKDDLPIKDKSTEKIVNKIRLMYKFIQSNRNLTKLTITKNPISELYTIIPAPNNDADKDSKYIIRDKNGTIIINGFFSFLVKIRDELLVKEDEKAGRNEFNIKFDIRSNVNKNSENYPLNSRPIKFKNLG